VISKHVFKGDYVLSLGVIGRRMTWTIPDDSDRVKEGESRDNLETILALNLAITRLILKESSNYGKPINFFPYLLLENEEIDLE